MTFNSTKRLFAGTLALVLVLGLASPAFAQTPGLAVDVASREAPVLAEDHIDFDPVCPDDCEALALERVFEIDPFCKDVFFDDICEGELEEALEGCLSTAKEDLCKAVAGELLSINSSALVIGGLASSAVWMIPAVAGIAGAGLYLFKLRANRD
ncbi:MAG: hypothetical protein OEL77_03125 [Nitrosopumilus sp.]|nr:hypothetical protein [Nitrosopumilus sp.]MDH3384988.1 hypothetical protein [Nitrosopumilus sp.]